VPKSIEPALVGIQRPEDLAPQYVDAGGLASSPALVRAIGVQSGGAAVHGDDLAAADRVVHRPHCAQAKLLDLAQGVVVVAAPGPLEEDLLQRRAATARERELVEPVRTSLSPFGIALGRAGAQRRLIRIDAVAARRFDGEEPAVERDQRSQDLQTKEIRPR